MSFEKRISEAPSASLAVAIGEAIQAHADHYSGGVINSDDRFIALVIVTAKALADIRDERERNAYKRSLFDNIDQLTFANVEQTQNTPAAQLTPLS